MTGQKSAEAPEALLENPEVRELLLRVLRNDYTLLDDYRFVPGPGLPSGITAFWGVDDPSLTSEGIQAWRQVTADGFEHRDLAGGHFYLVDAASKLLSYIETELSGYRGIS